eukprot:scaffold7060_cov28-Prasinocladus_malaysianus.AAC.1
MAKSCDVGLLHRATPVVAASPEVNEPVSSSGSPPTTLGFAINNMEGTYQRRAKPKEHSADGGDADGGASDCAGRATEPASTSSLGLSSAIIRDEPAEGDEGGLQRKKGGLKKSVQREA